MANFRGIIQGSRGSASRLGHSRLEGRVAGWNIGVGLCAYRDPDTGEDRIGIHADEGNGYNAGRSFSLGTVIPSDDGPLYLPSEYVKALCLGAAAEIAKREALADAIAESEDH